jgi:energy-coupling factor transporter ATP-binding protein EcfA2
MELFRELNERRGITIAFVTHEHDVAAYTRRIVALRDGRIVSDEPNVPHYAAPPAGPEDAGLGRGSSGQPHANEAEA